MAGIKLQIDSADKILLRRKLNKNGKAQQFFTHEVRRLCVPYVPKLSGTMEQTAIEDVDKITYPQPYSRRQYHENSGRNRSKSPLAGKLWDRRMMRDRGKEVVQAVANFCGGKAR